MVPSKGELQHTSNIMSEGILKCFVMLISVASVQGFVPIHIPSIHTGSQPEQQRLHSTRKLRDLSSLFSTVGGEASAPSSATKSNEDDDDEFEYIEYENLTEDEFVLSEWLVGTNFDDNKGKIDETWVRLVVDEDGKNAAYWGDKSEGKWALDVASQFLSISKDGPLGKEIWAGVVDDYYYLQGTVRGWSFWQPASVVGQWQARRLGVDAEEAGTAPWFDEKDQESSSEIAIEGKQGENPTSNSAP